MAKINLLPWREEFRQEKKKEFLTQLIGVAIAAGLAGFAWVGIMDSSIGTQNARNTQLSSEIAKLETQVQEINRLKKDREAMIARMQVIQDLQNTRPSIVHYFDEMVKSIPNGVFLESIVRNGAVVSIEGIAESNNRVSSFMRKLANSEWFMDPALRNSNKDPANGPDARRFSLVLKMVLPSSQNSENEVPDNG